MIHYDRPWLARFARILAGVGPDRQPETRSLIDNLRSRRCLLCGGRSERHALCPPCLRDLPWLTHGCPGCALPLPDTRDADTSCEDCQRHPPVWQGITALMVYDFPIDRLIAALKYHGRLTLADCLGGLLADALPADILSAQGAPLVIPIPVHAARLRQRGYNQALLLAQVIAHRQGWPLARHDLRRTQDTAMQKGLDQHARQANLDQALAWHGTPLQGRHVLLIDDVLTTGATLSAAARVLRTAGAGDIRAAVIARTLSG